MRRKSARTLLSLFGPRDEAGRRQKGKSEAGHVNLQLPSRTCTASHVGQHRQRLERCAQNVYKSESRVLQSLLLFFFPSILISQLTTDTHRTCSRLVFACNTLTHDDHDDHDGPAEQQQQQQQTFALIHSSSTLHNPSSPSERRKWPKIDTPAALPSAWYTTSPPPSRPASPTKTHITDPIRISRLPGSSSLLSGPALSPPAARFRIPQLPATAHTRTRSSPLPQAPRPLKRNASHTHAPSLSIPEIRVIVPSASCSPAEPHPVPNRQDGAKQLRDRDHRAGDVLRAGRRRLGHLGHPEPSEHLREAGKGDRRGRGIATPFSAARHSWEMNMRWQSKILADRGGRTVSRQLGIEDELGSWF